MDEFGQKVASFAKTVDKYHSSNQSEVDDVISRSSDINLRIEQVLENPILKEHSTDPDVRIKIHAKTEKLFTATCTDFKTQVLDKWNVTDKAKGKLYSAFVALLRIKTRWNGGGGTLKTFTEGMGICFYPNDMVDDFTSRISSMENVQNMWPSTT